MILEELIQICIQRDWEQLKYELTGNYNMSLKIMITAVFNEYNPQEIVEKLTRFQLLCREPADHCSEFQDHIKAITQLKHLNELIRETSTNTIAGVF